MFALLSQKLSLKQFLDRLWNFRGLTQFQTIHRIRFSRTHLQQKYGMVGALGVVAASTAASPAFPASTGVHEVVHDSERSDSPS